MRRLDIFSVKIAYLASLCLSFGTAAHAQDQDLQGTDIIVTGDRTSRSLLNTTTSVTVIDGDDATRNGGDETISEVVAPAPNVFIEGSSELPTIRGVQGGGAGGLPSALSTGALPRTAIIRDGIARPASIANSNGASLFDVEQVEILRGPQTLLRGRVGFAGAVIIETKDPTFDYEGALQAGLRFDAFNGAEYIANGFLSGPLTDNVAGRIVMEFGAGDDPRNVTGGPADFITEYDRFSVRGKLLGEFETGFGDLEVNLLLEHQTGTTPQTRNTVQGPALGADPADRNFPANGPARTFDTDATTASLSFLLDGEDWSFESVSGFTTDAFVSVPEQVEPTRFDFNEQIYTQEFLLRFGPQDDLNAGDFSGLGGLAFEERRSFVTGSGLLNTDLEVASSSQSIFADFRYGVTDDVTLQAGARVLHFKDDRVQSTSATIPTPMGPFTIAGQQTFSETDVEFLPTLGLSYEITDFQVISVTARRGYNPGGASVNFFTGMPYQYDAERVWTGELTYRAELPDQNLTFGATGFYNRFENPQFFAELVPGNRGTLQIVNQERGRSLGAEFEAGWAPLEELQLNASLGLLQTEITETAPTNQQLLGNSFGQDPTVTASLGAVFQATDWLSVDGQVTYRGESENDFNNIAGQEVGDYFIVDLGATAQWGPATMRAFVKNATDTAGLTRRVGGNTFVDVTEPLSAGVTITFELD
ncbi:MAG: TonB-dependent receptor [Pseudomonadota bacterium]